MFPDHHEIGVVPARAAQLAAGDDMPGGGEVAGEIERRGGEGGYMVILDCDDIEPWLADALAQVCQDATDANGAAQV